MFPPKLANFAPPENESRAENGGRGSLNYGANYGDEDWELMLTGPGGFTAADYAQRQIP
jgi:hypothetical protein